MILAASLALAQEPSSEPPPKDLAPLVLVSSVSCGVCAGGLVGCCGCLPAAAGGVASGAFLAATLAPEDEGTRLAAMRWGAAGALGGAIVGTLGSLFFYAAFVEDTDPQWLAPI